MKNLNGFLSVIGVMAFWLFGVERVLYKGVMKNEFVIHQNNMVHFYSEDSREFVTVTEYANWGDILKAADRDEELEKQAWPDAKKRVEFLKKMNGNFTHHKDAIFHGLPGQSK